MRIAAPATPPTTPPAMAPVLVVLDELSAEADWVAVGAGVVDGDEVEVEIELDDVVAIDSKHVSRSN